MPLVIIVWNPVHEVLQKLSLGQKWEELVAALDVAQKRFVGVNDELIFVAPDYLFHDDVEPYTTKDLEFYGSKMKSLSNELPSKYLVVAGSMQWVDDGKKKLSVSTLVASKEFVFRYDKKRKAGTEDSPQFAFNPGTTTGHFEWSGLSCGIEICQDHEEAVLLDEVRKTLDIHIMLSFGQIRRDRNMALKREGIFIQCELESYEYWNKQKPGFEPVSGIFRHNLKHHQSSKQLIPQVKSIADGLEETSHGIFRLAKTGPRTTFTTTQPLTFQKTTPLLTTSTTTPLLTTSTTTPLLTTSTPQPLTLQTTPQPLTLQKTAQPLTPPKTTTPSFTLPPPTSKSVLPPTSRVVQQIPTWQEDDLVSRCPLCDRDFSFTLRRHHCRKCGKVVCDDCSTARKILPSPVPKPSFFWSSTVETGALRVCDSCN
ncbi:FYVE zinc finger domain-containing protein [Sorangium atrum]|uniref:FYVE zinc finger domain-containing protein n=1 Tax=Sorangium atrum TaxID=2995308 RepID=A0ABT5BYW9_9BACT|nr:FYVE zinc finger domain-containing protein [Sorangium aterium]MDC0678820.1 FYVE zinc finger domain-containing protein [Sorangium aterium]